MLRGRGLDDDDDIDGLLADLTASGECGDGERDWFQDKCIIEMHYPNIRDAYDMTEPEFDRRIHALIAVERAKRGQRDDKADVIRDLEKII